MTAQAIWQPGDFPDRGRAIEFVLLLVAAWIGVLVCLVPLLPGAAAAEIVLETTINPNTAEAASLMRLSGIGPSRAQAIITYREQAADPNHAFERASDLERIRGIGPKTAEQIKPYLEFE